MKELKIRRIVVGLLIVFLFGSCMNETEYVPPIYSALGFLKKVNDDYYINSDDNKSLKITNASSFELETEVDRRVYAVFTFNETASEATGLLIELQKMTYVDYSDIIMVDDVSRDTLGNGELEVDYGGIYNNYLNMDLVYNKTKGDHEFFICYDEENQVDGELIKLELRNYTTNSAMDAKVIGARLCTFNLKKLINLSNYVEGDIEFELIINKGTINKNIIKFKYIPKLD